MTLLLLLVALGLAGASPLEDDKVCQPHSRPWQVLLHGGGSRSCSGALIDEFWVVTSFDCAPTPYRTIASLGEHDVTVDEDTEQHIYVADVIVHSPYRSPLQGDPRSPVQGDPRTPFHSLTMVRLAEPARFTKHIQPIPLPSRCPKTEETCQVSGWGSTTPDQFERYQRLKCLTVPVVDDVVCMDSFPEYVYWSYGMVCAGSNSTDSCLHDNSAVMVCDGQLQGVQWFDHACMYSNTPSVYTRLCLYNDWINDVMGRYVSPETTPMMTT